MANPGANAFNPAEAGQSQDLPTGNQGQEARLDAPKATDAVQTADAVVNKFQTEAGIFAAGDARALTARRETGAPLVDSRMQSFETGDGVKAGMVHSGTEGTFLTTNQGERYGITRGPEGQTVLTNAQGQTAEVIRTSNEINQVNRPTTEIGPATVHRQGTDISAESYTAQAQAARARVAEVATQGPTTVVEGRGPVEVPPGQSKVETGRGRVETPPGQMETAGKSPTVETPGQGKPTVVETASTTPGSTAIEMMRNDPRLQHATETQPAFKPGEIQGNKPVVETPGNRPGVETPGNRPGVETPGNRPGVETPGNRPGVETPGNRPGVETPVDRPESRPNQPDSRFNGNQFRESLKALESNPGDRQAQRQVQQALQSHPQEANRVIQQLDQQRQGREVQAEQPGQTRGDQRQVRDQPQTTEGRRVDQPGSKGDQPREGQRARGDGQVNIEGRQRGKQAELPAELAEQLKNMKGKTVESDLTKGDIKNMADKTATLKELMKNPDTVKAMQKLFEQSRDGKINITDNQEGGKALEQVKGKTALDGKQAINSDALSKQMGLDLSNPQTRTFLLDLGKRMQTLQQGEQGNIKIRDVFKGLDPVQAKTLQNFLTKGNPLGGDMTLNQVDPTRLQSLRLLLDGQLKPATDLASGKQGGLSRLFNELANKPPSSLDAPTSKVFGQNLRELGKALNSAEGGNLRLLDGTQRILGPNELTAKLTAPQDQLVRTLLENSGKLANLIETGKINLSKGDIARLDPSGNIIGDLITRLPGTMQGNNFIVKGEILGNLGAIEAAQQFIRGDGAAAAGLTIITRPDGSQVVQSPSEILSGKPIDPVTGLPYDPFTGKLLDPTTGRIIGQVRPGEPGTKLGEKWESSDKESDKRKFEDEKEVIDKKKAALLAAKARKLRELKEKELREKALKEEERRKEDKKRIKYIVKDGDTLESIAQKQLRDLRLAPLIYRINKKTIPVVNQGGKELIQLRKGLILWLPSPLESREFRGKLMSGTIDPSTGGTTESSGTKYSTPEEELAAKFGENWSGSDTDDGAVNDTKDAIAEQMMLNALKEQKRRQDNIEKVLGTVSTAEKTDSDKAGRTLYVVRLGESLKSVAMKHPQLRDISLWKLVAEVNKLPTTTDRTGRPTATLTRGSKIKIPTKAEIQAYREKIGVTKGFSPDVEKYRPEADGEAEMYICDHCGRMSVSTAKLCGCGKKISSGKKKTTKPTQTRLLNKEEKPNQKETPVETQVKEPVPTAELKTEESKEKPESFDQIEDLDSMTRLVKINSSEKSPMKYSLQVSHETQWTTLITYEIGTSKTLRHDEFSGKTRKTVKIDLPGKAAEELAKNDLTGNWKNYKRKFLRGGA